MYNYYAVKSPSISHIAAFMAIKPEVSCIDAIEAYKAKLKLLSPAINYDYMAFDLYFIDELPHDLESFFLEEVLNNHPPFWMLNMPYYDSKIGYLFSLTDFENWLGMHSYVPIPKER